MASWRISSKLIGAMIGAIALAILALGWLAVSSGTEALLEQQTRALEAVRRSRSGFIESYFSIIRGQIVNFARDEMVVDATVSFTRAFTESNPATDPEEAVLRRYYEQEVRPRFEAGGLPWRTADQLLPRTAVARALQVHYIAQNPQPVGSKHLLDSAPGDTSYDQLHRRFHPLLRGFLESFGYHDIFLFDLAGDLIYSVFKEVDFATNFHSGPYRDTNFAEVVREALEAPKGEIVLRDFAPYGPSCGVPASFVGSPIFAGNERIGVAVFQMPIDEIDQIMTDVAGLGESGETYLVGSDRSMRSDSRFSDSSTILSQSIDTEAARLALEGGSGTMVHADYRGIPVLASYGPLSIPGLEWVMLAEIDMDEVTAPAAALRRRIALIGVAVLLGVVALMLPILRRLVIRPVEELAGAAERVAGGDYASSVRVRSGDELGRLARSFNAMTSSIHREIDEREEAERAARDAQTRADEANHAKSTFLANMSHELRTPMNAILGYSEMLMEEAESDGQDEMVADLQKIHRAGKHLLNLINGVLDLSKIESGRTELYLETFSVETMLEDVVNTIGSLIAQNDNELVRDFSWDLGTMHADITKLRQVLFNLISNAAKFTDRGTITLTARREEGGGVGESEGGGEGEGVGVNDGADVGEGAGESRGVGQSGDRIVFEVRDSGIGIPAGMLDRVFQEFTQADTSTTREYGGTGLGLPIALRFCRMMGGDIEVESELGLGTTFRVCLPAVVVETADAAAEQAAAEAAREIPAAITPEEEAPRVGRCVLVIDDDPNACELMSRALRRDGFNVVTAASGEEGIAQARLVRPSVITLDVMMPGKDGWAVLEELKRDPELHDVPVVMVSMLEDRNMGYALGAADYLTKPVDKERLVEALNQYRSSDSSRPVLLVEDELGLRELMRRTLEKQGFEVVEATNGVEALERVREQTPILILLDLMMPVMDGFEFLRELRRESDWRRIPVIVVTAKDLTPGDRSELEGEVEGLLQKGAHDLEGLLDEVRSLVQERGGFEEGDS